MFRTRSCPKCSTLYDRRSIKKSKHLVKTKITGGPLSEPFSAICYEAWELACSVCGHTQDFDPTGEPIPTEDTG
jgi:hypothetical protein